MLQLTSSEFLYHACTSLQVSTSSHGWTFDKLWVQRYLESRFEMLDITFFPSRCGMYQSKKMLGV